MIVPEIKKRVEQHRQDIIEFLREICAIPSMDGRLKEVGERIGVELSALGFKDVRFDRMGNILGRVGDGVAARSFMRCFRNTVNKASYLGAGHCEVIPGDFGNLSRPSVIMFVMKTLWVSATRLR